MACSTAAPSLRVAGVVDNSIVDGPGLRYAVFTQGCPHHCAGCHNPETHDPEGGYLLPLADIIADLQSDPLLSGLTLSGGEPFCQAAPCATLAEQAHLLGLDVVCYSGYTYEQLLEMAAADVDIARLLAAIDLLIDGPYLQEQRNLELSFRGSDNQRLLDLRALRQEDDTHD